MGNICDKPTKVCPRYRELKVLYDISLALGKSILNIQKAFEETLLLLKKNFHLSKGIYYELNDERTELKVFASVGLNKEQELSAMYAVGEGATGIAAKYKEPVVIENVHKNILFLNKSKSLKEGDISYLAIPAISQNKLLGVLGVSLTENATTDLDEMVTILTVTSSFMAQAIQIGRTIFEEKERISEEKLYYKEEILQQNEIIGQSADVKVLLNLIKKVAPTDATVLINGETGTGKELIAKAIHNNSSRKEKPYIKLNCAAIPENLIESELFGHEKGAFTDARELRKGRFELADEGTLFLDEIGDLSPNLQAKLLRVLQEQEFERVGGSKTIKVNVRIIAATNRNLKEMIEEDLFREDLYYRINVIPIHTPPLRNRGDDIIMLSHYFLDKFSKRHAKEVYLSTEAESMLKSYTWPGNIRELENSMERAVLLSPSKDITSEVVLSVLPAKTDTLKKGAIETKNDLDDLERDTIVKALIECGGVKMQAAKKLQISYRQIVYKVQKYAISKADYKRFG